MAVHFHFGTLQVDLHRIAAGGQGVVEDIAEDLLEGERVRRAGEVDAMRVFPQDDLPAVSQRGQMLPDLAPDLARSYGSRSSWIGAA